MSKNSKEEIVHSNLDYIRNADEILSTDHFKSNNQSCNYL